MSDDVKEAGADDMSVYAQVVDISGIEFDAGKFDSVEDYKAQIVRHFAQDDEFEKLTDAAQDWVDEATKVFKKNVTARRKTSLPAMDGLVEETVAAEKKPRRAAAAKKEKTPRAKKEKALKPERDPLNNRYGHVADAMFDEPSLTVEQLMKKLARAGHEYSAVTLGYAHLAFTMFYAMGVRKGLLEEIK